MRYFRRVAASARRGLGGAVHRAGGATRSDVRALRSEIEWLRVEVQRLQPAASQAESLARVQPQTESRVSSLENLMAIDAVSRVVQRAQLRVQPLVSVVLPTYERPELLRRAIDSVLRQSYTRWELLVVDDGGRADSEAVVTASEDPRIRWMRIEHRGVCAARNVALAAAGGELIAYLDDDNMMDPAWLTSVVWAFDQRPEIDVLYGAFVVDDLFRVDGKSAGLLPVPSFTHGTGKRCARTIWPTWARSRTGPGCPRRDLTRASGRWATGTCF